MCWYLVVLGYLSLFPSMDECCIIIAWIELALHDRNEYYCIYMHADKDVCVDLKVRQSSLYKHMHNRYVIIKINLYIII